MTHKKRVLREAIEAGMFLLPELPGKVEKLSIPGIRGQNVACSDPFLSIVGAARLTPHNADATIRQVHEFFARQQKAYGWVTSLVSTPTDLEERLAKVGMVKAVEMAGMVLLNLQTPLLTNPDVTVRQATVDDLEQAISLLASAVGFTPEGARATTEALLLGHGNGSARVYLAYLKGVGQPVGVASSILFPHQRVVELDSAGTLEAYRGRGIYTSLVARRLEDAYREEARTAVVQAVRTTSAPILQKLGFVERLGMAWYIWEPDHAEGNQ